jgi:hypothetical protein
MTGSEIITKFRLQVDDQTELSSDEELDLLNDVYIETAFERPWNILKTSVNGTIVNNEIPLPADFAYIYNNRNFAGKDTQSNLPVIFVGPTYNPYYIINFDERRQYRNTKGFAYIDYAQNKIVFTMTPDGSSYEFDYIKVPERLTLNTAPVFPERFHKKFVYDMATQDSVIQMSDKIAELVSANRAESNRYRSNMEMWDSKLTII